VAVGSEFAETVWSKHYAVEMSDGLSRAPL
jgi:hypothetical protein